MSVDHRDIRRSMDVYTADDVYLGTVLRVRASRLGLRDLPPVEMTEAPAFHGELLGPAPTQPLGNRAPVLQSAASAYGTWEGGEPLVDGTFAVGRWWGLWGTYIIPVADVRAVSLERVALRHRADQLRPYAGTFWSLFAH